MRGLALLSLVFVACGPAPRRDGGSGSGSDGGSTSLVHCTQASDCPAGTYCDAVTVLELPDEYSSHLRNAVKVTNECKPPCTDRITDACALPACEDWPTGLPELGLIPPEAQSGIIACDGNPSLDVARVCNGGIVDDVPNFEAMGRSWPTIRPWFSSDNPCADWYADPPAKWPYSF